MIAVSHPTGNTFCRALLAHLVAADRLARFYTSLAYPDGGAARRLSSLPGLGDLRRRSYSAVPTARISARPLRELGRFVAPRLGLGGLTKGESAPFSLDAVYRDLDRYVARDLPRSRPSAVYAYEDGALETFTTARSLNVARVYDLPIAHHALKERLLERERERLPDWASTMGGLSGERDSEEKLARKDAELREAQLVVVPSRFVADSLPEWVDPSSVVVAPFGTPAAARFEQRSDPTRGYTPRRPLRVLFAGSMGQRKGLADLFAAVALLDTASVELVVLGKPLAPMTFYRDAGPDFTYEPTRPHDEVLALMRSCDLFCLPSHVEGRALVMQEAMSQGLPIIITHNTGGSDLVIEGQTGFIVDGGSPEAIADRIHWFLEHPERLPDMRQSAAAHAVGYTWHDYAESIVRAIEKQAAH